MRSSEEVYKLLKKSMKAAYDRGAEIVFEDFGDGIDKCCAVSSYKKVDSDESAASCLNISHQQALDLTKGFDNWKVDQEATKRTFYKVGQRLREYAIKHLDANEWI